MLSDKVVGEAGVPGVGVASSGGGVAGSGGVMLSGGGATGGISEGGNSGGGCSHDGRSGFAALGPPKDFEVPINYRGRALITFFSLSLPWLLHTCSKAMAAVFKAGSSARDFKAGHAQPPT